MLRRATLQVHVQPGAKSSSIVGIRDGVLFVRVAAPPRAGRANQALLALIAETLSVPKSKVDVVRGQASRYKTVAVEGIGPEELKQTLAQAVARGQK